MLTLILLAALAADPLEIPGAVLKIVDDVAVPAAEAGVLAEIVAKEGKLVAEGDALAKILDSDVRLTVEKTKLEADIAHRKAENDVNLRFAIKSTEVARAELRRSQETNEKYPKTVSDSELDRQRLTVEKSELETKQAEHEREVAGLTKDVKDNEHRTALDQLGRRTIAAPIRGMVVELHRKKGEWVQPGDTVARVIRLDKLRAEGFLPAKHAGMDLVGGKVTLKLVTPGGEELSCPGEITFVSPEIDPLNAQVRIWAEVENAELKLRPGMQATLVVEPK